MTTIPNRPRGITRNGGRKPLPEGEALQSITIQLKPALIAKFRAWCSDNEAKQGQVIAGLIEQLLA